MRYLVGFLGVFILYGAIGTAEHVDDIERLAPIEIKARGWEIMRHEGFEYGSFNKHGGYVWYHIKDLNVPNTYYRVHVTMWRGELQFYYGSPEKLSRVDLSINGGDL